MDNVASGRAHKECVPKAIKLDAFWDDSIGQSGSLKQKTTDGGDRCMTLDDVHPFLVTLGQSISLKLLENHFNGDDVQKSSSSKRGLHNFAFVTNELHIRVPTFLQLTSAAIAIKTLRNCIVHRTKI